MSFWGEYSLWICRIILVTSIFFYGQPCQAAQEAKEELWDDFQLEEVEEAVEKLMERPISFQEMLESLQEGKLPGNKEDIMEYLEDTVWSCIGVEKKHWMQILGFVLLAAVCANLSQVFKNQQIGELSFFMIYMFLVVMLLHTFDVCSEELQKTLENIMEFMRALLPAYHLAVSVATGTLTAGVFYQMILVSIYLCEHLLLYLMLPGIRLHLLLTFMNQLTKEDILSKLTELLQQMLLWGMKSMVGVLLGIQLLQRMILPGIDAWKRTTMGKAAEWIPGLGSLLSGATEMVLGSAMIIKNCMGGAAILILVLLSIGPVIQLGSKSIVYRFLAAVVQPVSDKRLVEGIHTMGESMGMLLRLLLTVELLFMLTIAILAGSFG